MATGAAGDGMFQGVYGGCISTSDMGGQQRPYHCNCSCALHKSSAGHCAHVASKVSYPMRRSWSADSMLAVKTTEANSPVSSNRPSSLSRVSSEFAMHDQ
ncbi:hypothetical protein QVD17_27579 [Tagetes erecta]|uniref:Uncharacterized protein n=1 Tax=Tagetes erecta TaxID=13708 RepID=A0AAD8K8S1_TARER|nr:hypothetical protein QVD17_27579 [Tagetes erecta]